MEARRSYQCEHYTRKCKLVSPCCNRIYMCRVCHDRNERHVMDRKLVKSIKCVVCGETQLVGEKCVKCGARFGKYFCQICNLFDDREKKQFHCYGCGICRVGGRENFFHCVECEMCLSMELKSRHTCVPGASRLGCSVCQKDIHSSREEITVPRCGHLVHKACYEDLVEDLGEFECSNC